MCIIDTLKNSIFENTLGKKQTYSKMVIAESFATSGMSNTCVSSHVNVEILVITRVFIFKWNELNNKHRVTSQLSLFCDDFIFFLVKISWLDDQSTELNHSWDDIFQSAQIQFYEHEREHFSRDSYLNDKISGIKIAAKIFILTISLKQSNHEWTNLWRSLELVEFQIVTKSTS